MPDININSPYTIMEQLRLKYKQRRLSLEFIQEGLSKPSAAFLVYLKRLEAGGHISLESLLKLSAILDCLDDFRYIVNPMEKINSIKVFLNLYSKEFLVGVLHTKAKKSIFNMMKSVGK